MKKYTITGEVEIFPQKGGWYYIQVPVEITQPLKNFADRGLIPILAKIGSSTWKTSLLPKGDGTHFIALKQKVRKKENIFLGDIIQVEFHVRTK